MANSTRGMSAQEIEVQRNSDAFYKRLPEYMKEHEGKFALMKDGQVVEFFDTLRDAYSTGCTNYQDGIFSIQEVTGQEMDLGWFSHVVPLPAIA